MTPSDFTSTLRLERPLARTPFGDAWAARSASDGVVMAVLLTSELVTLAADDARLVAALHARLGLLHATDDVLVPLLDVVDAGDGRLALLLPMEERAPASERLERGRAFSTAEVAAAARALGACLDAAHAVGTRHGGLCPGVLYLGGGKPVRVVGHGWVDALVEAGAERAAVLSAIGARTYAAPELMGAAADAPVSTTPARSSAPPRPEADIYAMGATLYACMTGRPPFGGRTTSSVMAAVLADETATGEVPRLPHDAAAAAEQAAATERLTQALLRAVERAPEDRWPSAGEFVRALEPRVPTPQPAPAMATPAAKARGCMASVALLLASAGIVSAMLAMR